ncbi:MAG: response regulator [Treponema sp.]|jgi:signal transduction histidine kinase/CheY-like chemotaxis protein|nr:response regulator [Treponema sp.]
MAAKTETKAEQNSEAARKEKGISIYLRILVVIIAVSVAIIISGLFVGSRFLSSSINRTMEDDLLITVDVAELYVKKEIELLKLIAQEAAREINQYLPTGWTAGILERVRLDHSSYIGLAVFDDKTLIDSCGGLSIPNDLINEPFMTLTKSGAATISTTMYTDDGTLVMYVPARINDDLVLAAILPGLYFSSQISGFTFWQSGHFYIDDAEGTVISNYREDWVQYRVNFMEMAKTDSSYNDLSSLVRRGMNGERGIGHASVSGARRISAFRPITTPEGWYIGVIAPLSESALNEIPRGILLIGSITMLLSIIAASLAASFLKRPYEEVDHLRREAEIASISKSTFLANMSHEIRTPMNSVMGFSELALDDDVAPKTRDYLLKIRTNAEWLLQIINDILDISKIEAGKMELENIPFDIHELFVSCRTLILPKAVEKNIMLHFYAEPSLGKRPLGDPTRLRQVFVNLLSNAIKFTNTGMVKLHSDIIRMENNSISIHFEIKDSGIGMTKEQIEKIFDPFTQAESGTTRKYGGTGLGLAITKNIIEMMGGKLHVESTPGVGTKFSFDLVFDTIDISDDEAFSQKVVFDEIEKPVFEGEILLCEDNAMNQQVICEHLTRVGLKTVVAENGRIGLDMVRERIQNGAQQFNLIFMDMHMPVMDGLEASSQIIRLDTGIPIVAMTANIMSDDREIYAKSGMNDCVGKPFTSQELWRCLMKYLTPVIREKTSITGNESGGGILEADKNFQKKLQLLFVKNNNKKFDELTEALKNNDIKLAHRIAHTLKSNAAQIGKTVLQKAAETVESYLKDENNFTTEMQILNLEAELNIVLKELSPLLEQQVQQEVITKTINPDEARELLEKLEPLVKCGNPESLSLKNDIRTMPVSNELKEKLIAEMEDFEFESAAVTIAEIRQRMG